MSAPLIESCRDASPQSERRHIRVMDESKTLCGTVAPQTGAGAGTFVSIVRWSNCKTCKRLAEAAGPNPAQQSVSSPVSPAHS